jgi:hypothetical protein
MAGFGKKFMLSCRKKEDAKRKNQKNERKPKTRKTNFDCRKQGKKEAEKQGPACQYGGGNLILPVTPPPKCPIRHMW